MGLDSPALTFLCYSKKIGVDFDSTLMIGRQGLHPSVENCSKVFNSIGVSKNPVEILLANSFAEGLFREFGATKIESMDFSSYESATLIHDLNTPIPSELKNRFSVVYDGGSLEHIFNIPQAFKNCMEMVAVGGHFLQCTVSNNFLGHGFWQVSPELIYRIFCNANGFQVKSVLLFEFGTRERGTWYAVEDPDQVKQRVLLCNTAPVYIFTLAQKIGTPEVFQTNPYQSDYSTAWATSQVQRAEPVKQGSANIPEKRGEEFPLGFLLRLWRKVYRVYCARRAMRECARRVAWGLPPRRGFDQPFYKRTSEAELLAGRI